MSLELVIIGRRGRCALAAAVLSALLAIPGCVSPPGAVGVAAPVMTGKLIALDNIVVSVTSSAGDLAAEQKVLGDSLISGLRQTGMFTTVNDNSTITNAGAGIKISVDITAIKTVTDKARAWAGALAGRARIVVRVAVTDLQSGHLIETFAVAGQSGASAFAGTTDEAIQQTTQQIVAEVLKLNAQTGP